MLEAEGMFVVECGVVALLSRLTEADPANEVASLMEDK